jgi:radical SAM-linked protein
MKYLIVFEKGESARWLGHLDILRTFERAIRRADLPIAFSTGFNPREKIAFASALSVGVTGAAEPATIELTEAVVPSDLVLRLNEKLPPGIQLQTAEEIPDAGSRDLLNSFDRAEIRVTCVCGPDCTPETAQSAADSLLRNPRLIIQREREGKVKSVDVRPLIHSINVTELSDGRITFAMVLALGAEGTAKPAEIIGLMEKDVLGLAVRRVHRVRLLARASG